MSNDKLRNIIWKHIRSMHTCMMITQNGEHMRARPMVGIARPEQNAIWFFTDKKTHTDEEIRKNPTACLAYSDMKEQTFVSVSGTLARMLDNDTIHDLWNEGAATYFPQGPDDPSIVLLKFVPQEAEYWDAPSSSIVLAIKFLEARVTGERPSLGSNGAAQLT